MMDSKIEKELERMAKEAEQHRINNHWYPFKELVQAFREMQFNKWKWTRNQNCKYVNIRFDMRDMGCIVSTDRLGWITLERLKFQHSYSGEKPIEWKIPLESKSFSKEELLSFYKDSQGGVWSEQSKRICQFIDFDINKELENAVSESKK
jgi:hypothetical protein